MAAAANPATIFLMKRNPARLIQVFRCVTPSLQLWRSRRMAELASLLCALLFLAAPGPVKAQVAGGSVAGTARNESGAALPGVRLTIRNVTTGEARAVTSDTEGHYSIPQAAMKSRFQPSDSLPKCGPALALQ